MNIFIHSLIQTLEHFAWTGAVVSSLAVCVFGYYGAEAKR